MKKGIIYGKGRRRGPWIYWSGLAGLMPYGGVWQPFLHRVTNGYHHLSLGIIWADWVERPK